jgi:hypothetical protein
MSIEQIQIIRKIVNARYRDRSHFGGPKKDGTSQKTSIKFDRRQKAVKYYHIDHSQLTAD